MHKLCYVYQIANVIAGYTFRGAIKEVKQSSTFVLQVKNIKANGTVDDKELLRSEIDTSHTKAFVVTGDVAIGSRGVFRAGVIYTEKTTLASSSVYLARIMDQSTILPEYLAAYLNSSSGQKNLHQYLTSGTIRTLLKKDLEKIVIPIPPIERQQHIIRLSQNIQKQIELLDRKAEAQKNLVNGIFNQLERVML